MDSKQRIANYLGLCQKAGKLRSGDTAAKEALRKGEAHLLLLAADAAPAVRRELTELAGEDVPILDWPDMASLGLAAGKSRRGAAAVLDAGFAKAMLKAAGQP